MEWLLLVLLLAALALYPVMDAKVRNAPLYWIVLLPLIAVFVQQRGWLSRLLQSKAMLWLGSLTMPLFLTHQMVISIVQHHLPDMPAVAMLAACLLVALTVSWGIQTIFSRLLRL
jgi:peptidoglycan/LPS O-acetylase OafA/YrhL